MLITLWPKSVSVLTGEQQKTLQHTLFPVFKQLLREENIPPETALLNQFKAFYLPLSNWLAGQHQHQTLVIGINGAQGSGKSTLTKILARLLEQGFAKHVVSLSIDDLYKTREQRQQMAETIHPLFMTRGVPGTHDVEMGLELFKKLKTTQQQQLLLPRFNKAVDDRYQQESWNLINTPVDIILFEGWCVGAIAEDENALITPINQLEATEDPQHCWRQYVNQQLNGPYQTLFSQIDLLIMLQVPDMKQVYQWRALQEQKLAAIESESKQHIMSRAQMERFIMHYERITRATLNEMPSRADLVIKLNEAHRVSKVNVRMR